MNVKKDISIGILLVTHDTLGESLIQIATHIMGKRPQSIEFLGVKENSDIEVLLCKSMALLEDVNHGKGAVILTDIVGATPFNITKKLIINKKIEGVSGVNLPMLLKAITYRSLPLELLIDKIISETSSGIVKIVNS